MAVFKDTKADAILAAGKHLNIVRSVITGYE
jgi:hypothetical protein